MSDDTEPINLPARVVRATYRSDLALQQAAHHKARAWDQLLIGVLFAAIGIGHYVDGLTLVAALFAVAVANQAFLAWHHLRARKKAQQRSDALFRLTYEHAIHRTLQPWPEEAA